MAHKEDQDHMPRKLPGFAAPADPGQPRLPRTLNPTHFVRTAGTEFRLEERPFYFQGTNFFDFGLLTHYSEQDIYRWAALLAGRGIRVMRIFGPSCQGCQYSGVPAIETASAHGITYNEEPLRRLDLALDAARAAKLRVILVLVNYEEDACSMEWWVHQFVEGGERELFYTEPRVRAAFARYVETLLTRNNTVRFERTGERLAYRDDETIMAVEAANEPHTSDFYEWKRGIRPGELVHQWLADITALIRTIDPNHLICTGEEGYKVGGAFKANHGWINNGSKGVDFERNLALPHVDFATVHVYPDNWNIPASDMAWARDEIVADRARISHRLGKPIVLEETGFDSSARFAKFEYRNDPAAYLEQMYRFANEFGYAGTMVWQALPPGLGAPGYNFDTDSPQFRVVEEQARFMNARGPRMLDRVFGRLRRKEIR
jgi:mannan endo-1,4-beta-mannosidase